MMGTYGLQELIRRWGRDQLTPEHRPSGKSCFCWLS